MTIKPFAQTPTKIGSVILILAASFLFSGCSKAPPPSPLQITWRGSALDSNGLVMQVHNISNEYLSCKMTAINYTVNQSATYAFNLGPYVTQEIGILECHWSFQSGESVTIQMEGYADLNFKVP
jgi:hypothetical protein